MSKPVESNEGGRIAFRIRIGVTGHRDIDEKDPALIAAVREQVAQLLDRVSTQGTPGELAVVSQLANGADRVVVREVMAEARRRKQAARLEVFLPFERRDYEVAQRFNEESLADFDRLLSTATFQRMPPGADGSTEEGRQAGYAAAGRMLVGRCDVLIALWRGDPSGGPGGTAETLLFAAARSKPCIWIPIDVDPVPCDNFAADAAPEFYERVRLQTELGDRIAWSKMDHPQEVLAPLLEAHDLLCRFNNEPLGVDFGSVLREEMASRREVPAWVGEPFVRATVLARRWQRRFKWAARLITLLAAVAAVMLAIGLSFGQEAELWAWAEAALLLTALAGLLFVRRVDFHRRWLSYRVLAERLRSAHFLAPTGADFRRQARLETVYSGKESTGWLMRAFEEVWDCRPPMPETVSEMNGSAFEDLRDWLANDWIGKQIEYHESATHRHSRSQHLLAGAVFVLFVVTIVFACLHALHKFEEAPVFFSIALPAAAASIGVMLTVNQHQALSERSARMRSDLAVVQGDVCNATADSLDHASSEVARVIAQETGAWFGSMWFLDIEHP